MPSGRIEQQIDLKVTGLKDVKDAEKTVKDLAGTKAKVTIEADATKAQRTVKDVLADVKKLDSSDAQIVLAIRAAAVEKELTGILADVATLDGDKATIDVELARANELRGDLDQLEGAIKEIDATTATVDVDTEPAQQSIRKVGEEGDKSRSVLANMVGNSAQDLGALGGVAGSAGVAIGQLAEYATEGDIALSGLATTVVPMAALGIAVQTLSKHFADLAATKAFNAERVTKFKDALEDSKLSAGELVDILSQDKDVGIFERWRNDTVNVDRDVSKFFKTFNDFKAVTDAGMPGFDKWADQQLAAAKASGASTVELYHLKQGLDDVRDGSITGESATNAMADGNEALLKTALALTSAITGQSDATKGAGFDQKFYGDAAKDATKDTKDQGKAVEATSKLIDENAQHITDWYTEQQKANDAAAEFNDTVASTDFKNAELDGAVAGMSRMHDQLFGLADIAAANEAAWDNLGESLKTNGKGFDLTTEKGRNNQQALEELSSTIDTQLAAAYDAADGNQQVFRDNATKIANDTLKRLQTQFGLSSDKAHDLAAKLGLLPEDIETRYALSGTEEARLKIGLLQGAISALPKDVQTRVNQQIITGDYQGALNTIQGYYNAHPVTSKVVTEPGDITGTLQLMQGTASRNPIRVPVVVAPGLPGPRDRGGYVGDPAGALVAERRPEFIRLPGGFVGLVTEPAVVPPGTQVTSGAETARILQQAAKPVAGSTTVHVHLPRGSRADDTVAAIRRYARRNGGRR